ncbi:MAG TPA: hypothetical protein VFX16_01565 [Pseudonocardiaceae bacterium]|nr:hypothetical protein [Pseudonocardiaceae bacterium]
MDGIGDADLAAARDAVLVAVRWALAGGGLSLRPPDVYTDWPMRPMYALLAKHHAGQRLTAPERDTWHDARVWRSHPAWLAVHGQTQERALVFVMVEIVERIAGSATWQSPYLDEHRIRLDLLTELNDVDRQAYELAELRHQLTVAGLPADERHDAVLARSWAALIDRVASLTVYSDRLRALETVLAQRAATERAELAEAQVAKVVTGWASDELAAGQVIALAGELRHETDAVTNSETSHRNAT